MGIRQVGVQTANDLANHFRTMDTLSRATVEELESIDGIGQVVAESIVAWFGDQKNIDLLKKFKSLSVWPLNVKQIGGKLSGKKFVITGSLVTIGREEAAQRIRQAGGTFQTAIANDTSYLVVGQNVGSSKLAKATKLGTQQINEQQLLDLLN
ncbi:MAG: hypothetical protein NVS1B10_06080 [Candidatus Saccharimonadales bacterium]